MRIGNNNYHILLNPEAKMIDRHYLGVTVLDNTVVKSWYADYRTKPREKLPGHFTESNSSEIAKKLLKHSRKPKGFLQGLVDMLSDLAPVVIEGATPIQDQKDYATMRAKFEKLTNEELYNLGVSVGVAQNKDGDMIEYNPDDLPLPEDYPEYDEEEKLTFTKRLKKDEYVAILLYALSNPEISK